MKNPPAVRCSEQVRSDGMSFQYHQCRSAGKVMRDGKMFCGVHDPVGVKERQDKRNAKWDAEWAAKKVRWAEDAQKKERATLCVAACESISDEDVKRLTSINRCDILDFIAHNMTL